MATAAIPDAAQRARLPLPDPGEPVPALSWPTVGLFVGALTTWVLATWAALGGQVTVWLTIPVHAAAGFVMFTVLHDASHYSISRVRWVNGLMGRLAVPFVLAYASFPLFAYIHIQHHRNANDDDSDPDTFASHGPWWQLPLRWAAMDLAYGRFYLSRRRTRPRAETAESGAVLFTFLGASAALIATGHLWELAVVILIPQRVALLVLAWWFDWLPHHGLPNTQRENRSGRLGYASGWSGCTRR